MVTESAAERQLICERISTLLESGAVDRSELLRMVKVLGALMQDLGWEVAGHLKGRNDTPEMQQADRWVNSAIQTLTWAEMHAPFALTFELARCVEIVTGSAMKVAERLRLQSESDAA